MDLKMIKFRVLCSNVYQTKICDIYDLQKRLMQTWVDFEQNVINAAIDKWRDGLTCMLVADTLNTCCKIIVCLYYVLHQNIL